MSDLRTLRTWQQLPYWGQFVQRYPQYPLFAQIGDWYYLNWSDTLPFTMHQSWPTHAHTAGLLNFSNLCSKLLSRYAAGPPYCQDFPRTIQSASCVLLGFGSATVPVVVPAPRNQTLLPNYDGNCQRYDELRATVREDAALLRLRRQVEEMLSPFMGQEPMNLGRMEELRACVVSTIWWNGYAVSIICISIGCNFGIERWSKIDRFCLRSTGGPNNLLCCRFQYWSTDMWVCHLFVNLDG